MTMLGFSVNLRWVGLRPQSRGEPRKGFQQERGMTVILQASVGDCSKSKKLYTHTYMRPLEGGEEPHVIQIPESESAWS